MVVAVGLRSWPGKSPPISPMREWKGGMGAPSPWWERRAAERARRGIGGILQKQKVSQTLLQVGQRQWWNPREKAVLPTRPKPSYTEAHQLEDEDEIKEFFGQLWVVPSVTPAARVLGEERRKVWIMKDPTKLEVRKRVVDERCGEQAVTLGQVAREGTTYAQVVKLGMAGRNQSRDKGPFQGEPDWRGGGHPDGEWRGGTP